MARRCFAHRTRSTIRRLSGAVGAALLAAAATGCASARNVYGERARFSPAFRGYVMAASHGSDDPDSGETVLVLRDPVTGKKLRCQEEVALWRELYEDVAVHQLRDDHAAIAAGVTTGVVFSPAVAMYPLGTLVALEGLSTSDSLYNLLRSENAPELFAAGVHLYERKRFRQSTEAIERALAKDASIGVRSKAYYYLGLAYAEESHDERARVTLGAFVDRAAIRDVDAYREAEGELERLGVSYAPCASTEPVPLSW